MMYDGTPDTIGMIPHLSAILGTRKIEAWGRPPLKTEQKKPLGLLTKTKSKQQFDGPWYKPTSPLKASAVQHASMTVEIAQS